MFRQIPIEITTGSHVIVLLPIYIPNGQKQPVVEMLHTLVTKTTILGGDKYFFIDDPQKRVSVVPEWRVSKYTFGKVWLFNHKFDKKKIDKEDIHILKKLNYPVETLKLVVFI